MDPGRETWHCIVIPRLDRELKDRSSASSHKVEAYRWLQKGVRTVFRSREPASTPSIQSRRRGRRRGGAREEEHDHENEHENEEDHEEEQWDNDAKQIPGQGTKVRKANLADPSGWSY
jgi:hypothetical protein